MNMNQIENTSMLRTYLYSLLYSVGNWISKLYASTTMNVPVQRTSVAKKGKSGQIHH